jgi:hypothetical protein
MQYRQIIRDAWAFAQANKGMMNWYALIPSIMSTLVGVLFISYQYFSFKKTLNTAGQEISIAHDFLLQLLNLIRTNSSFFWTSIIIGLFFLFFYLFYPTFSQGAIIQLIAKKKQGQETNLISGITYGLGSFLPMFEYHLVIKTFSLTAVIGESAFILRNLGSEVLYFLLPIFVLIAVIGLFITLFFTFAEWFIALHNDGMFAAMKSSTSLVFQNWQHTILILVLLLIIGIRVIINIVLVFFVPLLVFAAVGLFATAAFQNAILFIAAGVSLVALYIAGYLGGTLTIFTHAVWTIVFLKLYDPKN